MDKINIELTMEEAFLIEEALDNYLNYLVKIYEFDTNFEDYLEKDKYALLNLIEELKQTLEAKKRGEI